MKVFISVDIEGIWGIATPRQQTPDGNDYARARELMTNELNIVCEELFRAGATEIVVNDSHSSMDNLLIEKVHPDVSVIVGSAKPLSMMEGIDETFDCAMFIGYHPKAGTSKGIVDHTYSGGIVYRAVINNEEVSEAGINALIASQFGVPVVLVSGDDKITDQVKKELGNVETVAVKRSISRYAVQNLPLNKVKSLYKEAINRALKNLSSYKPKKYDTPLVMEVEFMRALFVEFADSVDSVKILSPRKLQIIAQTPVELFRKFDTVLHIAFNYR